MAISKEDIKKRIVTKSIAQQVEGDLSPLHKAALRQPIVTSQTKKEVEQQIQASQPQSVTPIINVGDNNSLRKSPVVTQSVKQSMEQPQSQELQSVLKRTVQQQPVVTNNIRQQVEGTTPSTPQSQELQSIQDRTEQQMAKQKVMQTPVATEQIKQAVESTTPTATAPTAESDPYAFFDNYLKSKQPTPEELEAERKRERRKAIFNAIGDGVSSLANLYFTTKGAPNSYNPADNMTRKQLERYERLKAERKADEDKWLNAQMRLAQLRDTANWRKQQTEYQKQRDNVADARYKEQQEQRAEQIRKQAEQWLAQFNYQKEKDAADREVRIAQNNANNQQQAAALAETRRYHDIMAANNNEATASKLRGKQLVFSDGQKNQVVIYENVWEPSMQQVFRTLVDDMRPRDDGSATSQAAISSFNREIKKLDTPTKKVDYVKQNWNKSPNASAIMLALAQLDPATMSSRIEDNDEDYSQYKEVDYSQYKE